MRGFLKKHIPIFLIYLLLTLVYTYPQILHITAGCVEPPIGGSNDQYAAMWDAWWVGQALFHFKTSPFYTHLLNYPAGASLALQELGLLNGILIAPFQFMFDAAHGLILGYNCAIIFSFVVSGLGMYALAFDISRSRPAAFIAGIGFAFLPYRAMYVTTVNMLSMGWIPLYVLFFSRTIRDPKPANFVWSAVFFALTLHSSNVYAFFLIIFSAVFVLASLIAAPKTVLSKRVIQGLALIAVLCFLVLLPNLVMILIADIDWEQPLELADLFSANPVGYFFPSDQQAVYNYLMRLLPPFSYYISGVPGHATFVSFTLLALFAYGIVKSPKREIMPWLITFAVFLVLSLGSTLHVGKWETGVRLPYYLLIKYLPFTSAMRTPFRFVVIERMALLVVAACGMKILFSPSTKTSEKNASNPESGGRLRAMLAPSILALLVMAELWHVPFKYVEADVPDIYFEIAKSDDEYPVVDLPVNRYRDIAKYMFYQTVHGKPIPLGIINRPETGLRDTTGRFVSVLKATKEPDAETLEAIRQYGARFVIMHSFRDGRDSVVVHDLRSPPP